jgi:TP901 family phage tail tape measure protein
MSNREIEARLKISAIDKTAAAFASVGKRMQDFNRRTNEMNKQQGLLTSVANRTQNSILNYAAPTAVAYGLEKAMATFADSERQFKRMGVTVNASEDEINDAFSSVQRLTKQFAVPLQAGVDSMNVMTASGKSMKDALNFLPSMLATMQATGAEITDVTNTGLKATDAFKIKSQDTMDAFDLMVKGSKEGQFEFKDMAAYVPSLANSFALLGYKGGDGLKHLVAMLQTLREDTGSAEEAATNASNIFVKMGNADTISKFKKFGIDNITKEVDDAVAKGEDRMSAFVRLSKQAVGGDLSKFPLLFTDAQYLRGMQSMATSMDRYDAFLKSMDGQDTKGTVSRDLQRIVGDTTSSMQRMRSSWDNFVLKVGKTIAGPASAAMDAVSDSVDRGDAITAALKKRGYSDMQISLMMIGNEEADRLAREGGYVPPGRDDLKRLQKEAPDAYKVLGRYPEQPHMTAEARGAQALDDFYGDHVDINVMRQHMARRKALLLKSKLPEIERFDAERDRMQRARDQEAGEAMSALDGGFSLRHALSMDTDKYGGSLFRRRRQTVDPMQSAFPARPEVVGFHERQTADEAFRGGPGFRAQYMSQGDNAQLADAAAEKLKQGADEGGQKLSEGGSEAGRQLIAAAQEMGRILSSAAADLKTQLGSIKVNVNPVGAAPSKVNANTGRTNTFANAPASLGHQ